MLDLKHFLVCFHPKIALAREEFSSEIMTEVATELEMASKKKDLFGGDIKTMSKIMKDMVSEMTVQTKNATRPASQKVIHDVTQVMHRLIIRCKQNAL